MKTVATISYSWGYFITTQLSHAWSHSFAKRCLHLQVEWICDIQDHLQGNSCWDEIRWVLTLLEVDGHETQKGPKSLWLLPSTVAIAGCNAAAPITLIFESTSKWHSLMAEMPLSKESILLWNSAQKRTFLCRKYVASLTRVAVTYLRNFGLCRKRARANLAWYFSKFRQKTCCRQNFVSQLYLLL
jgi:hypothetical protein